MNNGIKDLYFHVLNGVKIEHFLYVYESRYDCYDRNGLVIEFNEDKDKLYTSLEKYVIKTIWKVEDTENR
jgi:hypothetical protein